MPKLFIDFANNYANYKKIKFLRVDTNANEPKLRKIYEMLGFNLVAIKQEEYRKTAYYQKKVK